MRLAILLIATAAVTPAPELRPGHSAVCRGGWFVDPGLPTVATCMSKVDGKSVWFINEEPPPPAKDAGPADAGSGPDGGQGK